MLISLGVDGTCSAHLINEGVTVSNSEVTVQWQGVGPLGFSGPGGATVDNTQFNCLLDEIIFSCESALHTLHNYIGL